MPTAREVLKQSGMTDAQIDAVDAQALTHLDTFAQTATQTLEQAELARRAQTQMYEQQIVPALNGWGNEKANLEARAAYYERLAREAANGGFIAAAPPFEANNNSQPRNNNGQFTNGSGGVPGSPDMTKFREEVFGGIATITSAQWEYRQLFGSELPDDPVSLANQAGAQRMGLKEYIEKKYDFAGKRAQLAKEEKERERNAIREETIKERDAYWAERAGSNGHLRPASDSRYVDLKTSVNKGDIKNPLSLTKEERSAQTRQLIQSEVASQRVQ